jgi:hypothetical protein
MNNESMDTMDMSKSSETTSSRAKETVDTVLDTINNNKLVIGSIAGACGAAIFLLRTDSGNQLRGQVKERASDLYGYVSDQVGDGVDRVREMAQNVRCGSESGTKRTSAEIRHVS